MKEQVKLGKLLGSAEQRDAVHVAVIPVIAAEVLMPGQQVDVFKHVSGEWMARSSYKTIGIVDPYLKHNVEPDKHRFYVLLYPNTVTSLRHEWQHPLIDGDGK